MKEKAENIRFLKSLGVTQATIEAILDEESFTFEDWSELGI